MPQIDRLIEVLFKHGADRLVLAGDRKALLVIGGVERPIVKAPMPEAQVRALVAEVAPDDGRRALAADTEARFDYDCHAGPVVVEIAPGPTIVVRPAPAGAPRSAAMHESPADTAAPDPPGSAAPGAPIAAPGAPIAAPGAPIAAPGAPIAAAPGAGDTAAPAPGGTSAMERLFERLLERGGSDLHVSSGSQPMIRVDGDLEVLEGEAELTGEAAERLLLAITPERNREEFAERGDTDFAYELGDRARMRCNLFRDRKGPGGVFRVIPSEILTADDLNLSREIRDLCALGKGLVLVTGPTGSGKSTTLAAMVDLVNRTRSDHIITIEDPIEFVHPNRRCLVNQREVHLHTRGFKAALRAALREDPDVVLVGEMRDLETIAIAVETAETGHLVFGTLHTTSAVSTVDRLIDQFPADQQEQIRVMLSESLRAVIAQTLCKKIGGGRIAALEVMMVNPAISNLIREGKTFQIVSIMQTGKKIGMVTLNDSLLDLVRRKIVEPQEAYFKAIDKPSLLSAYRKHGIRLELEGDRAATAAAAT